MMVLKFVRFKTDYQAAPDKFAKILDESTITTMIFQIEC